MKKLSSIPMLAAICATLFLGSCKKESPSNAATGSGNLDAGKSSISFNNSGSFAGGSSFSLSNTITNTATSFSSTIRNVSLRASEISGMNSRTVTITLLLPSGANTESGSLTGYFDAPASADIYPALTLSSTNGTSPGTGYVSKSGSVTITKLTATEIEGTFEAVVENDPVTETLTVSNGKFSGKF